MTSGPGMDGVGVDCMVPAVSPARASVVASKPQTAIAAAVNNFTSIMLQESLRDLDRELREGWAFKGRSLGARGSWRPLPGNRYLFRSIFVPRRAGCHRRPGPRLLEE